MSTNYIKIYYGPVSTMGFDPVHKPQFLHGLRSRLRALGNRVDMIPVSYLNCCVLECCGYAIFKCNIRSLCFNLPYELDPVCQTAVAAVSMGQLKLQRARTYLWIWHLIDSQLFKRTAYTAKDYWVSDLPPCKEDEELQQCLKCCKISIQEESNIDKLNNRLYKLLSAGYVEDSSESSD